MAESRTAILERFRRKIAQGMPIIGGGAGTGISAKFEEAGGIDLIVIYNSGRFRMAGHGSLAGLLPYGDANAIVMQMAAEVLPVVRHTPVLAGVCATDPMRLMDRFLREVKEAGFAGVQNFPTVGLFDGTFRVNLEETGFGYDKEVEMIPTCSTPTRRGAWPRLGPTSWWPTWDLPPKARSAHRRPRHLNNAWN